MKHPSKVLMFTLEITELHLRKVDCPDQSHIYKGAVLVLEPRSSDHTEHLTDCRCHLVNKLCLAICDPMDCSMPGLPVLHQLLEFTQTRFHWVGDAVQPSHPLSLPSPHALNLSQHQSLFQWVGSSHQGTKVSEFQLYCGGFTQWVGLDNWLVKVSWLGKLASVFWCVELDFFSLECNGVSSNEFWDGSMC